MSSKHLVVSALEEIANYIELSEENKFRSLAYRRAARSLEEVNGDFALLLASGELLKTPNVGKGIGPVVAELVEHGKANYLDTLRAQYPPGIFELLRVPGLSLKRIGVIHQELGVATIADLERACAEQKLRKLTGFGKKTEENICEGLRELKRTPTRFLLPRAIEAAERIASTLAALPAISRVDIAGSVRRNLETVGDIDLCVVTRKPREALKQISGCDLLQISETGDRYVEALFRGEVSVDIYIVTDDSALPFFHATGSSEFVADIVKRAALKGVDLTLDCSVRLQSEREIFKAAGVAPVPPELREAPRQKRGKVPRLIEIDDIRGAFHIHTTHSDGRASVFDMIEAASDLEWEYAGISDHSKTASYAGGLTEERLLDQQREIENELQKFPALRIFKGSEVDILGDGSLDYARDTLSTFDFVVASIHSRFKMAKDEMTARMVEALHNPFVTFLGHMTGRKLLTRPGYELDYEHIFTAAAKNGVMIEINANPNRLDIDWRLMGQALEAGVIFCINPDAHSVAEMRHIATGVKHARKGGLEPKHIFNTLPVDEVAKYLKARHARAMTKREESRRI